MTGFPSRIKSYGNTFKHDRYLCDGELIQNNKTTDTVIHISTLSDQKIQLNKSLRNIVLGHPKSKLSCPLDTHTLRISQKLGLVKRKTNDLLTLNELDKSLRSFDQEDPVKYDFALFGLGVENKF